MVEHYKELFCFTAFSNKHSTYMWRSSFATFKHQVLVLIVEVSTLWTLGASSQSGDWDKQTDSYNL